MEYFYQQKISLAKKNAISDMFGLKIVLNVLKVRSLMYGKIWSQGNDNKRRYVINVIMSVHTVKPH